MGLKDRILKFASYIRPTQKVVYDRPVGKSIVTGMVNYLSEMSRFDEMELNEIFEQLYEYEPEIGGSIDRLSSLVAMSYKGFVLIDVGDTLDENEKRLLDLARRLDRKYNFRELFEILSELLLIYGNAYLHVTREKKNGFPIIRILPPKKVTILDKDPRIYKDHTKVITKAKYYIVNEGTPDEEIIPAEEVIHIKYKDTPIFYKDKAGRMTYGLYSISPLNRAILPVWWKRQTMIIDILWRYRNVPREHHIISSDVFNPRNYVGTMQERVAAAREDAKRTIKEYEEMLKSQEPDHGYVTLDTIQIKTLDVSGGRYLSPNELINQMTEYIWMAMNIPESVVSGRSKSSYASELVVSGYLAAKIVRIGDKIKNALLRFVKEWISQLDESLDVDKLDIKLELVLESSKMELFRQASIMADLGVFTKNEIRAHLGYGELVDEGDVVVTSKSRKAGSKTTADVVADVKKSEEPPEPMTPQSREDTLKPQ